MRTEEGGLRAFDTDCMHALRRHLLKKEDR